VHRRPPSSGLGSNTSIQDAFNLAYSVKGWADPVAAGLAKLRDPSPDGAKAREALIEAIEYKNTEFNAQGTEPNQRYESSAAPARLDRPGGPLRSDPAPTPRRTSLRDTADRPGPTA